MEMPAPNQNVLKQKPELVKRLLSVLPRDAVIDHEAETKAYECDALSAYRCPP
ncbi:MAG: FAD-binding oxidoreductase, partial [Paracoccaceae bacterium]